MSEENKALVRRWFDEVWNKGSVDAIDEMLGARAVVHGLGNDLEGPAGFKPFHQAFRTAFPDMNLVVDDMVAEGDKVALRWTSTGTQTGPFMGLPATNKRVKVTGMAILRVVGGDLVEGWNNFDQLGMLQQLGIVALPEPAV